MTRLTTFKVCGYTTWQKDTSQKMRRRSTVTADQACGYWREC